MFLGVFSHPGDVLLKSPGAFGSRSPCAGSFVHLFRQEADRSHFDRTQMREARCKFRIDKSLVLFCSFPLARGKVWEGRKPLVEGQLQVFQS